MTLPYSPHPLATPAPLKPVSTTAPVPNKKFAGHAVLKAVRKALGRRRTAAIPPTPPELPEPVIRLVHTEFGLPALFAERAMANKMGVTFVSAEDVAEKVVARLKELGIASLVFPPSPLLTNLGIIPALIKAGIAIQPWDETSLDAAYDVEACLTDAWAAVAETGSIVVQASAKHGRGITLVPTYHLAILEPKIFLPDLVDLFEKLSKSPTSSATSIITGPSKTADIELNLVTGVHGPGHVEVFILK